MGDNFTWEEIYGPRQNLTVDDYEEEKTPTKKFASASSNKLFPMGTTSMDNRDPQNLNSHVQVTFDDVFGEPEGLRTPDGCWNCSEQCYNKTRECCYIFLVVLFAPCVAFISACSFACVAFQQVWCVGPCLRLWKINFATCRKFWWGCLLAICGPCAEVMGLYFSKVKVQYQKLPDNDSGKDDAAAEYFNV